MLAYTTQGYENLVNLSTLSHQNHFHKPLVDFAVLSSLSEQGRTEGIAVMSGCFFGYAVQQLIKHGEDATKRYLAALDRWFPGAVYVELQNHLIDQGDGWTDDSVAEAMAGIADHMGLPCVVTQDSHYIQPTDRPLHDSLKQLIAFGPDPDDAVFPGDGFHLADDQWLRAHHGDARLERGLQGLGDLLSRHTLAIPVLDSYTYSVPQVVPDPTQELWNRIRIGVNQRNLHQGRSSLPMVYANKIEEEMEVITEAGMGGYMLMAAMITDWMQANKVLYQTRGSAAGSLVCYLLGISNVDPLKWDLRFERFLSKDRTKPPDVDLDIAHDRREELIEWLNTRFTAHQIGTWAKYSLNPEEDDEEGGSLMVKYFSTALKHGHEYHALGEIPSEDRDMLYQLSDAKSFKGMGTNAAGIVITSTPKEFDLLVPLAWMSRGGFVSQYHLKVIEDLGLVKFDALGSKTLTVLQLACDNLGWPTSKLEEIPLKDKATFKMLRSGDTSGIFQLEGNSSKWGVKSLKPDAIKDVIAAMALFRPGVQKVKGDKHYIARKHGKEEIPQRHEMIMKITEDTYGVMLYQEQVIDLLRGLGMGADDLTAFLKAVKASNSGTDEAAEVIASYQNWLTEQCTRVGMSQWDMELLDTSVAGFAEYGFNRAHATVYGLTAYYCAYLVTHHPLEFHAALMAVAAGEKVKENKYLRATKGRGVRVLQPSLNVSGPTYTVDKDRGVIRRGLRSIDGVGAKTAAKLNELAPFKDMDDLLERYEAPITGGKEYDGTIESLNGTLGKLRDQGYLDLLIMKQEDKDRAAV